MKIKLLALITALAAGSLHAAEKNTYEINQVMGPYAEYFEAGSTTIEQIFLDASRAQEEAAVRGDSVGVSIEKKQKVGNALKTEIKKTKLPDPSVWAGVNNFGSRYSSETIANAGFYYNTPTAKQIMIWGAWGLPRWDNNGDSEGGSYSSLGGEISDTSVFGKNTLGGQWVQSKNGGVYQPLGAGNEILKLDFENRYLIAQSVHSITRIDWVSNNSFFDKLKWGDTEKYFFATLGAERRGQNSWMRGVIQQGLGGSRSADVELLGEFDDGFTAAQLEARGWQELAGFTYQATIGGQLATDGLPSDNRMSLGGPGRGRSQRGGVVSTQDGVYWQTEVRSPLLASQGASNQFYGGVEGGTGWPSQGARMSVSSIYAGVTTQTLRFLTVDISYAADLNSSSEIHEDDHKINFNIMGKF